MGLCHGRERGPAEANLSAAARGGFSSVFDDVNSHKRRFTNCDRLDIQDDASGAIPIPHDKAFPRGFLRKM